MGELGLANPIIILDQITKSFKIKYQNIIALQNINLKIDEGEFVAVVGPSGAGKTTLLNIIGGLDKPDSGEVTVLGKKYSTLDEDRMALERALNIGIVFQNYNLISTFTAIENIEIPLFLLEFEKERIRRRAEKLLGLVDLKYRSEHLPSQLSSGEQQRISFARALANDPPIILADEPTANLDKENVEKIVNLLNNLKSRHKTIIIATHDKKVLELKDKIVYLYQGEMTNEIPSFDLEKFFELKP